MAKLMANVMAKRWQPRKLLCHLLSQLDNGINVRTNERTYVDNYLRKISSSRVRDARGFVPDYIPAQSISWNCADLADASKARQSHSGGPVIDRTEIGRNAIAAAHMAYLASSDPASGVEAAVTAYAASAKAQMAAQAPKPGDHAHAPGDAERDLAGLIDAVVTGDVAGGQAIFTNACPRCTLKQAVSMLAYVAVTHPGLTDALRADAKTAQ